MTDRRHWSHDSKSYRAQVLRTCFTGWGAAFAWLVILMLLLGLLAMVGSAA